MGKKNAADGGVEQPKKPPCPIRLRAFKDQTTAGALVVHLCTNSRFACDVHARVATRDEAWRTGCHDTHYAVVVDGDARSDQAALERLQSQSDSWSEGVEWAIRRSTKIV